MEHMRARVSFFNQSNVDGMYKMV